MNSARFTYLLALAGSAFWCLAIVAAPLCAAQGGLPGAFGEMLYTFFRPLCHQLPDRSISIAGHQLAVCTRCTAVYFAFALGTLLYPLVRKMWRRSPNPRTLLVVGLAPMLLDVAASVLGVHEASESTRLLTGALLGVLLPFVILPVAMDGFTELTVRLSHVSSHHQKGSSDAREAQ